MDLTMLKNHLVRCLIYLFLLNLIGGSCIVSFTKTSSLKIEVLTLLSIFFSEAVVLRNFKEQLFL